MGWKKYCTKMKVFIKYQNGMRHDRSLRQVVKAFVGASVRRAIAATISVCAVSIQSSVGITASAIQTSVVTERTELFL